MVNVVVLLLVPNVMSPSLWLVVTAKAGCVVIQLYSTNAPTDVTVGEVDKNSRFHTLNATADSLVYVEGTVTVTTVFEVLAVI